MLEIQRRQVIQFMILTLVMSNVLLIDGKKHVLTVAGFQPLSKTFMRILGRMALNAGNLAIEDINNRTDILPDYDLSMKVWDTQLVASVATKGLFDAVSSGPTKIAIFGPLNNVCSKPIGALTKYWNLITVPSAASTSALANRNTYPNLFSMDVNDVISSSVIIEIMKRYNWSRIAVLYKIDEQYELAAKSFMASMAKENITLITSEVFMTDDISEPMKRIKDKGAKIIMFFAGGSGLRVFCEAYLQKLYGRHYVWFDMYHYMPNWWRSTYRTGRYNCTLAQIEKALSGYFTVNAATLGSNTSTLAEMTPREYLQHYKNKYKKVSGLFETYHTSAYDGMWTIAVALNKTENILQKNGSSLLNFTYTNTFIRDIFFNELINLDFNGISGPIKFSNGLRINDVEVLQGQVIGNKSAIVKIGIHHGLTKQLEMFDDKILWTGGYIPADQVTIVPRNVAVSQTVFIVMDIFAAIAIALAFAFFFFNFRNRKLRYIKMSSPNINNFFLIGCVICYAASITFGIDGTNAGVSYTFICSLRVWLLSIGFSATFGSLLSKTWRVYRIFTSGKKNKILIKDRRLIEIVVLLIVIDIMYLLIWQLVEPLQGVITFLRTEDSTENSNQIIQYYTTTCSSSHNSIWIGILYGMKFLVLIFGTFLAWETRHVTIPALNDSHYIGMSVYNIALLCTIGIIVSQFLGGRVDAGFAVIAGFIIFGTTVTMCFVFVPKIMHLRRKSIGNSTTVSRVNTKNESMSTFTKKVITTAEDHAIDTLIDLISNNSIAIEIINKIISVRHIRGSFKLE